MEATSAPFTHSSMPVMPLLSMAFVPTTTAWPTLGVVVLKLTITCGGLLLATPIVRLPEFAEFPAWSQARTKIVCSPMVVEDHDQEALKLCATPTALGEPLLVVA